MIRVNGYSPNLSPINGFILNLTNPDAQNRVPAPMTALFSAGDDLDLYDLNNAFEKLKASYEGNYIHALSDIDYEDLVSEYLTEIGKDISIPEIRIERGFDVGLIDFSVGAIIKGDNGWHDDEGKIFAGKNATLDEVKSAIKAEVNIIPHISREHIHQATESGILSIDGTVVAERVGEQKSDNSRDLWKLIEQDRTLTGNLIRVIHHLNHNVSLDNSFTETMFHGCTSNANTIDGLSGNPLGGSVQGNALYMTKSILEAATIYANPESYEVKGKKYIPNLPADSDLNGDYGFLLKAQPSTKMNTYRAGTSHDDNYISIDQAPSPFAIKLLTDEMSGATSEAFLNRSVIKTIGLIFNAENTYDVYSAMNELNDDLRSACGKEFNNDVIKRLVGSLGYDAIDITRPTPVQIDNMKYHLSEFEDKVGPLYEAVCDENMPFKVIQRNLHGYLRNLEESIPAKMDVGHVLIFNDDVLPVIDEIVSLPIHEKRAEIQKGLPELGWDHDDPFYSLKNKDETRFDNNFIKMLSAARITDINNNSTPATPEVKELENKANPMKMAL